MHTLGSYIWLATHTRSYIYSCVGTHIIYSYGEMHEAAHTRMGTHTHMGEPMVSHDTCMGSPYAYGQPVRVWAKKNCPYAYGQNTCMGRNIIKLHAINMHAHAGSLHTYVKFKLSCTVST